MTMTNRKVRGERLYQALGTVLLVVALVAPAATQGPANPRLVPFQGRLTDTQGQPRTGVFAVTFAIYDEPTGGEALWSERHGSVSVINGQINVLLGALTSLDDPDNNGNTSDAIGF